MPSDLTPDAIRAMPAGRDLDRLVAVLLGWEFMEAHGPWLDCWAVPGGNIVFDIDLPGWSASPATTGPLLAEMARRGWAVTIKNLRGWTVWVEVNGVTDSVNAPTLSESVAKAFVLAGMQTS